MIAVTRPLEEAAREVLGVRRVRSRTIRGATEISVIFNPDADMPYALQLMQGKVDEVRPGLPSGTEIRVERMTPSLFPMMSFNVTGDLPASDLRDIAMFQIRPLLSRIPGVSRVDVSATDEREVSVIVDPNKLNAARLTLDQVAQALKNANQITSVGRLPKDYQQFLVLATGELTSLDDDRRHRRRVPAADAGLPRRHRRGARRRRRSHHAHHRQRPTGGRRQRRAPDPRQHPRDRAGRRSDAARQRPVAAARDSHLEGVRPGGVRPRRGAERRRGDPHRQPPGDLRAAGVPARLARHLRGRDDTAVDDRRHVLRPSHGRRHDQPHVDGRSGDRDRSRHRRCDCRRRRTFIGTWSRAKRRRWPPSTARTSWSAPSSDRR